MNKDTSQTVTPVPPEPTKRCYDTTELKDLMTININNLSKSEILELERQIQEYKKTEKFLTGYKVTFCVKFNSETHWDETAFSDPVSFGEWLNEFLPDEIIKSFNLKKPEGVSGFVVNELRKEQMPGWFV